ncbi:MAG: cell division protein FtsX [Epsilonproteobacteria bacterium]|nr:cell division protein FtsX [Campylobacterota bacterium]
MKSFKEHTSLVLALLGILFSVQVFIIVERTIDAYKQELASNYSLVIVSEKKLDTKSLVAQNHLIASMEVLSAEHVIKKLNPDMSHKSMTLLQITLPKFYKVALVHYPSPNELSRLTKKLFKMPYITKIETFAKAHDTTYKLLLLFQKVVGVFAITVFIVTILLIAKELRIWQFKHNERMSIMGLFGAPTWLRSAVLFRLAIVDAILATLLAIVIFSYFIGSSWIQHQLEVLQISVTLFDYTSDSFVMLGISMVVAIVLAFFVVLGHKEEV